MPDSLGQQLLVGAAGGILSLGGKYLIDWFQAESQRAKLKVDFRGSEPGYRVFTDATAEFDPPQDGMSSITYKMMYGSISVVNERRQTAKNCRGFLVGIDIFENGRFFPTDYCDSIPLAWSYRSDEDARKGVDIPRGVKQFLNVLSCCQEEIAIGFRPSTIPPTLRFASRVRFKQPGEFRFRIQVTADNADTQLFGLRVKWEGDWAQIWRNNCEGFSIVQDTSVLDRIAIPF